MTHSCTVGDETDGSTTFHSHHAPADAPSRGRSPRPARRRFSRRRRLITLVATTTCGALAASADAALAAPPANDSFAAAQVLIGDRGTVPGTNVGATKEPGEPNHGANPGGASVWYRWAAPYDGQFRFATNESDFDTVLAVYSGGALTSLAAVSGDDDSGENGSASELSVRATRGTTYQIAVDGFQGKVGRIVLGWRPAPANDNFFDAAPIMGAQGTVTGTTRGATREAGEPQHAGERADRSVWFQWTAPSDVRITFTAGRQGILAVYTGSSLATLSRKGARGGGPVAFTAAAGSTYFLAVDHSTASFTLRWGLPPPNDEFENARRLAGLRGRITDTNLFATAGRGERGAAIVWYRWRAPTTRRAVLTTTGSNFDTVLAVFTGATIERLRLVRFDDDSGPGLASLVIFRATGGRVYRIGVAGYDNADMGRIRLAWRPAPIQPAEPARLTGSFP